MSEKKNGSSLAEPERAPEPIVLFYIIQNTGPPSLIQGLGQTVTAINVLGPSGSPMQKTALRMTFPSNQSTEHPVGLVAFGTDHRCHFVLNATDACKVHCKVWAQLNSGPDVWIIEDSSELGTQVQDEESLSSGNVKIVRGRRQASKGLQSITIGSSTFSFLAPISNSELESRKDWFRCHQPIPVTKAMFDRQVGSDNYDLCRMSLDPIGEGANGKVYKFMERHTALFFAIKEEKSMSKEHKAMVLKEINFMKRLRHPFLVEILFDDSDNKPLPMFRTAMPLYLGHLRSILPLPNLSTTERVMLQIAEGLRFMHSNLILHRDLKPSNVLVVSPGNIKIADYGWATSLDDTDSLYGICGTAAYCAPEAFRTSEIHTPAIDVYSLGAIFYELLDLAKVERGWVVREFQGREEMFNTTFENASENPPHRFPGLVQSMLAPSPRTRCSLGESIEIIKTENHSWTKQNPLMPMATETHLAAAQFGAQRTKNPTVLQQTPFGRNGKKAKNAKPTPCAQDKRPEHRQTPQQAPVKHDLKNCRPAWQRQEPARPALQALPVPKPRSKRAQFQGVDFDSGLPSYEEATSQNPFASLARKEGVAKNLSHLRRQIEEPRLSRHPAFRSRNQAVNLHRANDAGVHRRHEPPARQAWRNKQLAELQRGAYGAAKGSYDAAKGTLVAAKGTLIFSRALLCLACDGLLTGGERVFKMFKDNPAARQALDHAAAVQMPTTNVTADAKLVASVQRQARRGRQRSVRVFCSDEEMLDRQLMLSRKR